MESRAFSPREVAEIIGVSESTVKRWVDAGRIVVHRTEGGHRRILLPDLVRFLREGEMHVARPDLLGIEIQARKRSARFDADHLYELLVTGDGLAIRSALVASYLDGIPLVDMIDNAIAPALDRLGALWRHGEEGIFLEHRAMMLMIDAFHQIRALIPQRNGTSPVVVGGAPSGDPYILPSLCVATVLQEAGFRAVNLGADTPTSAFVFAVHEHDSRLVWLSMTSVQESHLMEKYVRDLDEAVYLLGVPLVVGGQAAQYLPDQMVSRVSVLETMRELVIHVRGLFGAAS
jgi:MerR family transcriptional regulator, light-induced transcriptional regulator